MSKYFLFSYQLLAPLMLLNISMGQLNDLMKNEVVLASKAIDNQAELKFGDNQKKISEKPEVQIKKEKNNSEIENDNHKKKKSHLDNVDRMITILENTPYLNENDAEESVLGKILYNLSGTLLYGTREENI